MLNDFFNQFENGESFENNQKMFVLCNVLKRVAVKSWRGNDFEARIDSKHNKSNFQKAGKFCTKNWIDRYKKLDNEQDQKKSRYSWYKNLAQEMKNGA